MKHKMKRNTEKQTNRRYAGVAALSQVCLHGWSVLVSQIFMRLCTQWQYNDNDTAELCRHHKYYLASIYFLPQMHICLSWRRSDKYLSAFWHHCRPKWDFKLTSLSVVAKFESEVNLCSSMYIVKVRLSSVGWRVPWMLSSERSKLLDVPGCWAEKMLSLDGLVLVRSMFGCHLTPFLQKYTQAMNSWRIWSFWHFLYKVHY